MVNHKNIQSKIFENSQNIRTWKQRLTEYGGSIHFYVSYNKKKMNEILKRNTYMKKIPGNILLSGIRKKKKQTVLVGTVCILRKKVSKSNRQNNYPRKKNKKKNFLYFSSQVNVCIKK